MRWKKPYKHFCFLFFNPLKVTGRELEIESLGWVHGGELGGANSLHRYGAQSVWFPVFVPRRDDSLLFLYVSFSLVRTHSFVFSVPIIECLGVCNMMSFWVLDENWFWFVYYVWVLELSFVLSYGVCLGGCCGFAHFVRPSAVATCTFLQILPKSVKSTAVNS